MHHALAHLTKRVGEVGAVLDQLLREVEAQLERETQQLDEVAYGDDFDAARAPHQEEVVQALQTTVELLDAASDQLRDAGRTLDEVQLR